MKAYWCSPRGRESDTDQTPAAPAACNGVALRCQLLKSPTIDTVDAEGARKTNRTMRTVSAFVGADATVRTALGDRDTARPAIAPATAIMSAAATALTAENERFIVRRRVHQ